MIEVDSTDDELSDIYVATRNSAVGHIPIVGASCAISFESRIHRVVEESLKRIILYRKFRTHRALHGMSPEYQSHLKDDNSLISRTAWRAMIANQSLARDMKMTSVPMFHGDASVMTIDIAGLVPVAKAYWIYMTSLIFGLTDKHRELIERYRLEYIWKLHRPVYVDAINTGLGGIHVLTDVVVEYIGIPFDVVMQRILDKDTDRYGRE